MNFYSQLIIVFAIINGPTEGNGAGQQAEAGRVGWVGGGGDRSGILDIFVANDK